MRRPKLSTSTSMHMQYADADLFTLLYLYYILAKSKSKSFCLVSSFIQIDREKTLGTKFISSKRDRLFTTGQISFRFQIDWYLSSLALAFLGLGLGPPLRLWPKNIPSSYVGIYFSIIQSSGHCNSLFFCWDTILRPQTPTLYLSATATTPASLSLDSWYLDFENRL